MKISSHWLDQAKKIVTSNFDERPLETDISLIIIHCISLPPNQFGGSYIDQLFCNKLNPDEHPYFKEVFNLKVSAHLLINRSGEITQYVAFNKRAWHAGLSEYKGRSQCNDYSIGIELEGTETQQYTDKQYEKLTLVSKALFNYYPGLSSKNIVGHCHIAPERKTDPGKSFNWEKFLIAL